jgi:hypothetical protein
VQAPWKQDVDWERGRLGLGLSESIGSRKEGQEAFGGAGLVLQPRQAMVTLMGKCWRRREGGVGAGSGLG